MRIASVFSGSRDWTDTESVRGVIRSLIEYATPGPLIVIHGDCLSGLDKIASNLLIGEFGAVPFLREIPMPAPWGPKGNRDRSAGMRRNEAMLKVAEQLRFCGYAIGVEAWPLPQSRGTTGLMERARARGIDVRNHGHVLTSRDMI